MNTPTNAVSESHFSVELTTESSSRPTRPFYWSVRRELWENKAIYIAPLAAAVLLVLGTLFNSIREGGNLLERDPSQQLLALEAQWSFAGLLIMGITFLVAIFYCLDAFYGERRDRSIFFWKSLPVSDTVAVLAKTSIPLLILPLVTFVIAAITQWLVLAIDAAQLASLGRSVSPISHFPLLQIQAGLLYHLIAVHALWYAPIYGWFLLVSAWAPRVPILWAILPPFAIEIVEKISFHTTYFARFLEYRFSGGPMGQAFADHKGASMLYTPAGANLGHFLASPGLWGGLLLTAIFLAAAIQLRRYRVPS